MLRKYLLLLLLMSAVPTMAGVIVQDDAGQTVVLSKPARRIVTLAPHAMELVHAAGGGERIVGKGSFSDYPVTTRSIEVVGDNRQMDLERVLRLKPDLLIAWRYGVPQRQVEQLRQQGVAVFYSDPRGLDDIPDSIVRLGRLLGTEAYASSEAKKLRIRIAKLKARYANRPKLRVFWQISERPLYTLNDQHIVSEAIQLCGGKNVFGKMKMLAPMVSVESVLMRNPQVIILTSVGPVDDAFAYWRRYSMIDAVKRDKLFRLSPDLLSRPGPRMVDGVEALCEVLDRAR